MSSCDTFDRNSLLISSIFVFSSRFFCSSLFAVFSSEIAFSSVSLIRLKFSPSCPISFRPPLVYFALKSRFAILAEIYVSSFTGFAILCESHPMRIIPTSPVRSIVYRINSLEILAFMRMLSIGMRIIK